MDYANYQDLRERVLGQGVIIAIDGPSGSGKSTIARNVAAALDLGYLDTGAMYRAAAWWVEHQGVDLKDPVAVGACVAQMELEINAVPHAPRIFVGGVDVKNVIRTDHINSVVSAVAAVPEVRSVLIDQQRDIIAAAVESGRGIVAEGRDITTVVAPHAQVRLILTADPQVRLARRSLQNGGDGGDASLEREKQLVIERDTKDAQVTAFLEAADGVETLDSTNLDVSETLDAVMRLISRRLA